jgi:hypothetical protein
MGFLHEIPMWIVYLVSRASDFKHLFWAGNIIFFSYCCLLGLLYISFSIVDTCRKMDPNKNVLKAKQYISIGIMIFLILGILAASIPKTGDIMWLDAVKQEQIRKQEEGKKKKGKHCYYLGENYEDLIHRYRNGWN